MCCLLACGKRRPPLPPLERTPQRTQQLSGTQQGNEVTLRWPAPPNNQSASGRQNITRIDIYRLAEQTDAPLPLTEEEFARRATLIGSVDALTIRRQANDMLTYVDTLAFAGAPARLRYALRYVNSAGQRAAFSNFLLLEPTKRIALPPVLETPIVNETFVRLAWQAPAANVDRSTPVNLLGYNVYRRGVKAATPNAQTPLNTQPITETNYDDKSFRFNEQYSYFVRSVSLGANGEPLESLDSNVITLTPRDTFPPSKPTGLSIAAAPHRLALFFAANPERDVAGYNVYRSLDTQAPLVQWTNLTPKLLTRTTFQDETVESGKRYYYYINAVDLAGNVSLPSDVVSEIAP